ncbi:hypothetical protein LCGC14_2508360 [marine sediment metagenome]|uniref:Uncharacterized protein n=1 Tax=marine sediment metagenome TaxID=412755 RepID=A0A0F9BMS3_9ZZZZ
MVIDNDEILEKPIRVYKKDAKRIIILTVLLVLAVAVGSFYGGQQYAITSFIEGATSELNDLLESNFSYVCGTGWDQIYMINISIPLLVED